ncbi:MAG: TRAP transporter small permease subunit [Rhodospirillales bacterium]|nr:TRAP transporter small permease subunit [Rhodospirillales bacterium]
MPEIDFVLPHWAYWSGLVVFPVFAFIMLRCERAVGGARLVSTPVAYLFLVTGGFLGLHRLYLRNRWWWAYVPFVLLILHANVQLDDARNAESEARNARMVAEFRLELAQEKADDGDSEAAEAVEGWNQELAAVDRSAADAQAARDSWSMISSVAGVIIVLALAVDLVMVPRLARHRREIESGRIMPSHLMEEVEEHERPPQEASYTGPGAGYVRIIGAVNGGVGQFVAWWALIAVFAYYYEVVCRYVFNSPTNFVHEGMFLMFGMQYLLTGAFALRENAHVRVDVVYAGLSGKTRAILDLITSVFFFVFTVSLFWTGYIFFSDSAMVWEVSFTEWAIQYWPVKASIMIGAGLLVLQGLARVLRDIATVAGHDMTRRSAA